MKKVITIIMSFCLTVCGISIGSSAADKQDNVFYYDNDTEIVVEGNDLSYEEMQAIADYVATDSVDDGISTRGIACIFGHKLTTSYATETQHNAYSSSPKCLVRKYKVQTCSRSSCDYINKELVDSYRTSSCHG